MPFIPADKMKILREAAKNGDERAKSIIMAHFQKKDYSKDLEDYFSNNEPDNKQVTVEETVEVEDTGTGNARLDEFLRGNNVKKGDPDYDDAVEDYYREFPEERPAIEPKEEQEAVEEPEEEMDLTAEVGQGILELITKCDQLLTNIFQNDDIDETSKKGAMTTLQEVKQNLFDNAEKIKKVKKSFEKKEKEPEIA